MSIILGLKKGVQHLPGNTVGHACSKAVTVLVNAPIKDEVCISTALEREEKRFESLILRPFGSHMENSTQLYDLLNERKIVDRYQKDDTYSRELRTNETPPPEVHILDNIIAKAHPLEKEAVVYRSIDFYKGNLRDKLKKGEILEDKAFGSTCKRWDGVAKMWKPSKNKGVTLRIRLPKGTKGIDCSRKYIKMPNFWERLIGRKPKTFGTYYSGEFILPRNYKLQIKEVDLENGIVDCDYLLH